MFSNCKRGFYADDPIGDLIWFLESDETSTQPVNGNGNLIAFGKALLRALGPLAEHPMFTDIADTAKDLCESKYSVEDFSKCFSWDGIRSSRYLGGVPANFVDRQT
ncbi:hypothetical protein EIP91_005208, partial [Steccherinum ochraceum]